MKIKCTALKFLSFILVLSFAVSLSGCNKENNFTVDEDQKNKENFLMETPSGIGLYECFSYTGPFVEDGSDEPVSNVAAIKVKNTSETYYQTLRLSVSSGDKNYNFFITSFFPGDVITALETDRQPFERGDGVTDFAERESSRFAETPSDHLDEFIPQVYDGVMNFQNVSGKNFEKDVYVYYKNVNEAGYLGGITYRVNLGPMKKGEIKQGSSSHLSGTFSKIVFVTYGE